MKKLALILSVLMTLVMVFALPALADTPTLQEALVWAQARLGEGWQEDYDGINGCQDVDLIKYYFDFLGGKRVYGYAYVYQSASLASGWTRSSTPQLGDIAVWGQNAGIAGQYGHVGIVTGVSGSNITYIATNDGATQCTQHTVSRYNPSTYIHPVFGSYSYLDINWRIDGANIDSTQSIATVDIYIDGKLVANDVNDYYAQQKTGAYYEIKDIKTINGYSYLGTVAGQLSGSVNGNVSVRLAFEKQSTPISGGASVVINSANVPIRQNPNTNASILGYAFKGNVLSYNGYTSTDNRGVNWYGVSYNYTNGWVSSNLSTLKEDPSAYTQGDTVNVTSGNTNVRAQPNLSGTILGVAYKGSSWTYLGSSSVDERGITWYQIYYKGYTAWISSVYTELSSTSQPDWSGSQASVYSVTQSAYLVNNNPTVNGEKAFDGITNTCWCVSEYNYSFGQWVEVTYTSSRTVSGMRIYNGYNKIVGANDYWQLNSRVSTLAVYCDGAYVGTYQLNDLRGQQAISFGKAVSGKTFRFVIRGAYPGSKYSDVCISEIELY